MAINSIGVLFLSLFLVFLNMPIQTSKVLELYISPMNTANQKLLSDYKIQIREVLSEAWNPRRKSATGILFLPASCNDNTLTYPSVEATCR